MSDDLSGHAYIEDDAIVIRVAFSHLPTIIEGAWAANGISTRLKVTDVVAFAKDLSHALNDEDEEGTTPIHRLFDHAIEAAFESGADGVEEYRDPDA